MKKILTLIVCLCFIGGAYAQEKTFSWGVKAGVNVADFVGGDFGKEAKGKVGFHVGAIGEYRVSNVFAIAPELLFSTQGTKVTEDGVDGKMSFGYINLPVLARFYVIKNLSLEVGPQFGYVVSAKMKVDGESEKIDKDSYNAFDVAIVGGATYNFRKFFAQARYNYGLTEVAKESKLKNSVIQFSVGYKF